jgi:hypothetical protein
MWMTEERNTSYKKIMVHGGERGDSNYQSLLKTGKLLDFRDAQNA